MEDHNLIREFNHGKEEAFKTIFYMYYHDVFRFIWSIVKNEVDAEDIALITFQSLFNLCTKFHNIQNIKAFLFLSAKNGSRNYLKLTKNAEVRNKRYSDSQQEIEHLVIESELLELIYKAIEQLPVECKRVFKMLYYGELPPNEIAKLLNITVQTVYAQKHRAIKALKLKLL
jgi:RNA polymerase sigma-70 factor (ECF subfamily)